MAVSTADAQALAAALLEADRAVVLTGLRLGRPGGARRHPRRRRVGRRGQPRGLPHRAGPLLGVLLPHRRSAIAAREPTPAHLALARLQRAGAVSALITQAVDRLHARAGSTDVVEVYGTLLTERCERCGERYGLPEVGALIAAAPDGVPRCTTAGCAYPLRPEGTLWGEPLPRRGRRAGLGAGRRGRRLRRARLGPAHGADLAAALGAPDPRRAAGGGGPDPDPVRPLRPHPGAGAERRPDDGAVADLIAARGLRVAPRRGPSGAFSLEGQAAIVTGASSGLGRDDGPRPGRGRLRGAAGRPPPGAARRRGRRDRGGGRAGAGPSGRPARPRPRRGAGGRRRPAPSGASTGWC